MYSTAIKTKDTNMNRITNVRLHTPSLQEYIEVCAILPSLKIIPPVSIYSTYIFIYESHATVSDSTHWFNNHTNTFMETSDYIKRRGLKHQFILKRKGI